MLTQFDGDSEKLLLFIWIMTHPHLLLQMLLLQAAGGRQSVKSKAVRKSLHHGGVATCKVLKSGVAKACSCVNATARRLSA